MELQLCILFKCCSKNDWCELETNGLLIQGDRNNVDTILQVSVSANFELYQKIRRDTTMCEALRELMKDEIEKDVNKGIEIGMEQGLEMGRDDTLYSLVEENLLGIEIAARKAGILTSSKF